MSKMTKRKAPNNEENEFENERPKRVSNKFTDLSQMNDLRNVQNNLNRTSCYEEPPKGLLFGVIERIYIKNFKCHSFLEFDLHPYINFILGRNGSGKSAVMDAVILCLGGRAAFTGRQASAKTFVKTNCDHAEISITLRNEGDEAFKPKEYGSKIIIERRISKDGASSYKILNDKHKLVSNKKQEIDNIVEQFNIQVDNPVCFLNQETSKHFLNSSNQSDKYKLFMKASQLESMKRLQEQVEQERQNALNIIQEKKLHQPKLEDELYVLEDKYKKCQSVEKLRKKLSILMHEYSWAVVINCEKILEASKKERAFFLKSKEKHEKKVIESEKNFEEVMIEYEKIKSDINNYAEETKLKNSQLEQSYVNYKACSQNFKSFQTEINKLQVKLNKKKTEFNSLNEKLKDEKMNAQKDFEEEKKIKESKIEMIKQKLSENSTIEKQKYQENQMYNSGIEHEQRIMREKKADLIGIEKRVKNLENDIENLKNAKKDQIYRFGEFMADIVTDVKRHYESGRFKQMPLGPIGMYIQPKRYDYSLAIEQCLGQLINAFVCGNYQDEILMHQIMSKHIKEVHKRPRIIVIDFNVPLYDHNRYRPDIENYPTVYEMLTIKDHVIANTLFDQRKIESILLLPDRNVGRNIIEGSNIQNCQEAFLKNGDQLLGKPSFRIYACRSKESRFFLESTEATIELKLKEINELKEQYEILSQEINQINVEIESNRALFSKNEKQLDSIRREQMKLNALLREAEGINIPEPVNLVALEEEINKIKLEIEDFQSQISTIEANSADLKQEYDTANNKRIKCEEEMNLHNANYEKLKNNYDQIGEKKNSLQKAVEHYKRLLSEMLTKEKEKDESIKQHELELEKITRAAMDLSPRIETKRSTKTIDSEVQHIEKQIQTTEKLHGNEEEITRKYIEMRTKYRKIREDIKRQEIFLTKLKELLKKREEASNLFTQGKALRCAMDFSNYLRSRHYNGNLKFNHEEQKLEVIVHPNKFKDSNEPRDLKSLSGGERSFSTVAFLLSLWSIVESPILFLDEFDVFMDQINRSFAMDLILSSAKEKLNGQYVFLTPQEMGCIKPDNFISMFKMPDPKRSIDMVENRARNDESQQ